MGIVPYFLLRQIGVCRDKRNRVGTELLFCPCLFNKSPIWSVVGDDDSASHKLRCHLLRAAEVVSPYNV